MTVSAAVRFSPVPPAFRLMRKSGTSPSADRSARRPCSPEGERRNPAPDPAHRGDCNRAGAQSCIKEASNPDRAGSAPRPPLRLRPRLCKQRRRSNASCQTAHPRFAMSPAQPPRAKAIEHALVQQAFGGVGSPPALLFPPVFHIGRNDHALLISASSGHNRCAVPFGSIPGIGRRR